MQFIWAGKPYPEDYGSIDMFNDIMRKTKQFANCGVLTGYEMELSGLLKKGSDVWLNNPRMYREASGTSGMTAAMNGSINVSIPDGWVPEFSKHGENCFVITPSEEENNTDIQDDTDNNNLLTLLEQEVLPLYYDKPKSWMQVMKKSMKDIIPMFDSNRMAKEYYEKMYLAQSPANQKSKSRKELVVN